VEYKEKLYIISPESQVVHFVCRSCSNQLALAHVEGEWTNSMFCSCGRQYWVDWQKRILHMGLDDDQIIGARITKALRYNGLGRFTS